MPTTASGISHLWVVIAGPDSSDKVAIVNMTGAESSMGDDTTVTLQKGDHPFLYKETVINYSAARATEPIKIQQAVAAIAVCRYDSDCGKAVLKRIQLGALQSKRTPKPVQKMVKEHLGL